MASKRLDNMGEKEQFYIVSKDYKMIINGNEIVNFDNELETELKFIEGENGKEFILNMRNNLPGNLTILLEDGIEEGDK